jgi:hypothetical protein
MLKAEPASNYPPEEGRYLRGNDYSPVAAAVILIYDQEHFPPDIENLVRVGLESGAALSGTVRPLKRNQSRTWNSHLSKQSGRQVRPLRSVRSARGLSRPNRQSPLLYPQIKHPRCWPLTPQPAPLAFPGAQRQQR